MNIFLCGYMASGKSTSGEALSKALNRPFIDLDEFIEIECQQTIQEMFDKEGEAFFRQKEVDAITAVAEKYDNAVVSLGGGTLIKDENVKAIRSKGTLIYLEASPECLVKRIKKDYNKRPLLEKYKTDEELMLFIQAHLKERLKYYQKADIIINTENKTIDDIVKELMLKINQRNH